MFVQHLAPNYFFRTTSFIYHFNVYEFRNLVTFEFFQLLTKLSLRLTMKSGNLQITKLSPIKQLSFSPTNINTQ